MAEPNDHEFLQRQAELTKPLLDAVKWWYGAKGINAEEAAMAGAKVYEEAKSLFTRPDGAGLCSVGYRVLESLEREPIQPASEQMAD